MKKGKMSDKMIISEMQKAVGHCPHCKKYPKWFNDIPLRAFCWGTEKKEHKEWSKLVPLERCVTK
jgi:hypothetical protein